MPKELWTVATFALYYNVKDNFSHLAKIFSHKYLKKLLFSTPKIKNVCLAREHFWWKKFSFKKFVKNERLSECRDGRKYYTICTFFKLWLRGLLAKCIKQVLLWKMLGRRLRQICRNKFSYPLQMKSSAKLPFNLNTIKYLSLAQSESHLQQSLFLINEIQSSLTTLYLSK